MIRPSPDAARLVIARATRKRARLVAAPQEQRAYGLPFWHTYASNLFITTANCVLVRYSDFVFSEGGGELLLGLIVGLGMIGSLAMRAAQGIGIDVYGVRRIWLLSSIGYTIASLGHLLIGDVHGPAVFLLRMLHQTSLAGIFGASITFISRQSPVYRMAEVVGTLGTSGFLGMIFGAVLVDQLYGAGPVTRVGVTRMFIASAALGAISGIFAWLATYGHPTPARRRPMSILWLLKRYNPGPVLVMSVVMGFGIGLSGTFLRPFAASLNISGVASFFSMYAVTAFVTRLSIRSLPERIGLRAVILIGVGFLAANMLSYLPVSAEWEFVFPALLIGVAHAMLFPAVVAGGSSAFPDRYRGLGTTLMLAMFDLGMLIGAPTAGGILRAARVTGLPEFPTMFIALAVVFSASGLWYALVTRRKPLALHAERVD